MKRSESINGSIRGRSVDGMPNPVDVYVGKRVKQARINCGYSQQQVAEMMNMTFQQIQKYENAANRIGCSRLLQLSRVLNVPVGYFFEGYSDPTSLGSKGEDIKFIQGNDGTINLDKLSLTKEDIAFLTDYKKITNPTVAKGIADLVRTLASIRGKIKI